jgi:hypothetical protein
MMRRTSLRELRQEGRAMPAYARLGPVVVLVLLLLAGRGPAVGSPSNTEQFNSESKGGAVRYAPPASGDPYTTPLVLNPDVATDYPNATGTLTYYKVADEVFHGHIEATGLLAGFPYQLKLVGKPSCASFFDPADDWGNEQIGPEGFWWLWSGGVQTDPSRKVYNDYEEYDDCGHGDSPVPCAPACGFRREEVPHDFVPAQTAEWCYEGVIVFYGSFSDANGNISWDFTADWSYPHAPPEDNRDDHPFVTPPGAYNVRFVLNESAHNPTQYGGPSTAVWRGVLIDWNTTYEIGDADSDGIADGRDLCPGTPTSADVDTNGCSDAQVDADGDGVCDPGAPSAGPAGCTGSDNCPAIANPDQTDTDSDGQGDACDTDDDNDTFSDTADNCPLVVNPSQADTDSDGQGDACDTDDDNDTFSDTADNCPLVVNPSQADTDSDGQGDACDADDDNDTFSDTADNCPLVVNPSQADTDSDGQGDACDADDDNDTFSDTADNCPLVVNPSQADTDSDGQGDACDADDDNDGVPDTSDADPLNRFVCQDLDTDTCDDCSVLGLPDASQDGTDTDADGVCNAGDVDDDNDTVPDGSDTDPLNAFVCRDLDTDTCDDCSVLGLANPAQDGTDTDSDGACNAGDADDDNDTVPDGSDTDPLDSFVCQDVDTDTCDDCSVLGLPDTSQDGADADADGVCNAGDNCPEVHNADQANADADAWGDACDYCPTSATLWYTPAGDEDCDGFSTADENHVHTDPLDACPDNSSDDVWPFDTKIDREINILDVVKFIPVLGFCSGDPSYDQRYDLMPDSCINILDVVKLIPVLKINAWCTNP